jgi:hypothetical protein
MKSVNKVILLGNLTRDPELKQSEGKKPVLSLGWQPPDHGRSNRENGSSQPSFTALSLSTSWRRRAPSISKKAGKSMLKAGYSPTPTKVRTGSREQALRLYWKSWSCLTACTKTDKLHQGAPGCNRANSPHEIQAMQFVNFLRGQGAGERLSSSVRKRYWRRLSAVIGHPSRLLGKPHVGTVGHPCCTGRVRGDSGGKSLPCLGRSGFGEGDATTGRSPLSAVGVAPINALGGCARSISRCLFRLCLWSRSMTARSLAAVRSKKP